MGYLIGILVFTAVVVLGMGSYAAAFLDLTAMLVILPALPFAAAAASWGGFPLAFLLAFGDSGAVRRRQAPRALACLTVTGNAAMWLGGIGALLGTILVLHQLQDPSRVGPGLALAILSVCYGLVVKIMSMVAAHRITNKYRIA